VQFTAKGIRNATWTACLEDKRYDDALVCGKTVQLSLGGYGYRWFWMHRSALR
jgi:maltose alpha-D-glucosyltransferase/alpha-amylase